MRKRSHVPGPCVAAGAILALTACGSLHVEAAWRTDAAGVTASESRTSHGGSSCLDSGPWRSILVHLQEPKVGRTYEIGSASLRILYGARDAVEFESARGTVVVLRLEPERLVLAIDVELLANGRVVDRLRDTIEFGFGRVTDDTSPGLRLLEAAK